MSNMNRLESLGPEDRKVTYLTDLDRCEPQSALSRLARRHHWRTLDYETDSFSGTMLLASAETNAPEVSYPLAVSGWHAIHFGVYQDRPGEEVIVQTRLTDDPCFSLLSWGHPQKTGYPVVQARHVIQELFWKVADLTGQRIAFQQLSVREASGAEPGSFHCTPSRIAYVKLVPLSEAEVEALQADRQRTDSRRLFAHNDAHGPHWAYRLTTPQEIQREIEPYRDTDFSRIDWEAGGGDVAYFLATKVARLPNFSPDIDLTRAGDRLHAESWQVCCDRGLDPFQVALDHAHGMGLEFHAGYRTAGFYFPPPLEDYWNLGGFYEQHLELRAVAKDGNPVPRLAYSFPEVRRYVVSFLREVAQYPVDGVCLLYNRRLPLVDYEPPLVEGFRSEYGEDPRKLDERDPNWLSYRCRILTQFMREVREAMDAAAREQGRSKRIEVSAIVAGSEEGNLLHGIDVKTWIAEGLVDMLIPYTSAPAPAMNSAVEAWTDRRDVEYWVAVTKGTPCQLSMSVLPRFMSPEQYRRKAAMLYGAGVESLFFWDSAGGGARADCSPSWDVLRRLGHREEIEAWVQAGEPALPSTHIPVRSLGGWNLSYSTPG